MIRHIPLKHEYLSTKLCSLLHVQCCEKLRFHFKDTSQVQLIKERPNRQVEGEYCPLDTSRSSETWPTNLVKMVLFSWQT
jgi:hypothetical protein